MVSNFKEEIKDLPKKPYVTRKDSIECPHSFGYLANRTKEEPIPEDCLICLRMIDCIKINLL